MKKYSKGCYSSGGQIMPGDTKVVSEKKSFDSGGVVGGESTIKKKPNTPNFTMAEQKELSDIKNDSDDPNAYKKAVQKKIGFTPKKYPAGSESSNDQLKKYDTAVNYINKGFRPITKGDKVVGYRSSDDSNSSSTNDQYSLMKRKSVMAPSSDTNKKLTKYADSGSTGFAMGGIVDKVKLNKKVVNKSKK